MKKSHKTNSFFRHITLCLLFVLISIHAFSQTYITRNGTVSFFSEAPLENIEAVNRQVSCALDIKTGEVVFSIVIRSFVFEKALMQEHFNDNFMESKKYPNATYEGKILNIEKLNLEADGVYEVLSEGKLTIKDVTKNIQAPGTLKVKDGAISGSSKFLVKAADYNISIPSRYMRNIAEIIEVMVDVTLTKR